MFNTNMISQCFLLSIFHWIGSMLNHRPRFNNKVTNCGQQTELPAWQGTGLVYRISLFMFIRFL